METTEQITRSLLADELRPKTIKSFDIKEASKVFWSDIDFEDEDTNILEPSTALKDIINLSVLTVTPLRFIELSPNDYDALKAEVDNLASELAKGSLFGVRVKS